jgi:hypothetical protein
MDAELKAKEMAKMNPEDEKMVIAWISEVTGAAPGGDILDWLKDGKILLALATKLTYVVCVFISRKVQMTNLST